MNVIKKLASSLDGAVSLVLGEDIKRPVDFCIDRYPFLNNY